ncbi:PD-(D/E)XK nuclease-like domain-containing protein [Sphingobacterium paludis]|uniref:PDDEXK-like uncharacterized protein DUF3799 n=1 Tax=Sphingobacterium paludis TaxID=1476465 RepID=A0A4R7D718_9SPHI|nr:PD-(D/E)XK nuclease-like domain-containing protein [Sphingobacterium paludis]TDS14776.1 PDDEXK-like uncharacterized protein DUF3799 [Sphingobacterium paludis]
MSLFDLTTSISSPELTEAEKRQLFIKTLIKEFKSGVAKLSYSALSKFKRSPNAFINYKMKSFETTDSMILGKLVHALVLEPDTINASFYTDEEMVKEIGGASPRSTKAYKEWKANQLEIYPEKELVSYGVFLQAKRMAKAVLSNRAAKHILSQIHQTEHKIEFEHDGIKFTSFLDGLGEIILDLKICTDADPRKFQRDIIYNNYHIQAGVYTTAVGEVLPYYIIAVDRECEVSVHHLMEDLVMKGISIFEKLVTEFKQCLDKENFDESFDYRAYTEEGVYKMDVPPYLN